MALFKDTQTILPPAIIITFPSQNFGDIAYNERFTRFSLQLEYHPFNMCHHAKDARHRAVSRYMKLKKPELRAKLRARGLRVSGNKDCLAGRLAAHHVKQ